MALQRGMDGTGPVRAAPGSTQEERRRARSWHLGTGTLACPGCDAPVALTATAMAPADPLGCPYCGHAAALRDFLSLAEPTRPTRVRLRVVDRPR
jgi:hypothetical protein